MNSTSLNLIESLASSTGIEFDPLLGDQALRRAERDVPGEPQATWRSRLERAGKDIGLRVEGVNCPVREAVKTASPATPVVAFTEEAGWLIVTERSGRRARVARNDGPRGRHARYARRTLQARASWRKAIEGLAAETQRRRDAEPKD